MTSASRHTLTNKGKACGQVEVALEYFPHEHLALATPEVPDVYFPVRTGCRVTLYQDAHQPDGFLPTVTLGDGSQYHHGQAWRDVYAALQSAKEFIYITGWSLYTEITLIREEGQPTLGEILKAKAAEGVQVNIMLWDDQSSVHNVMVTTAGVMNVHDEQTKQYFKGTTVMCRLVPREGGMLNNVLKRLVVSGIFSHHQKSVICDAPPLGSDKKRVVAFIGGLDLTNGRYDTGHHSLFRTRFTEHDKDFCQNCVLAVPVTKEFGPREPWHDIHVKLEGSIAHDVKTNFEERWRCQVEKHVEKLYPCPPSMYVMGESDHVYPDGDPASWHVQLFRSIDSRSAVFAARDNVRQLSPQHLLSKKGRQVDNSIHRAYVHQIRRAKHFIYIENQYFLGSCQAWSSNQDCGATHLVPIELATKICDKIAAGERFAAYVVVPMFPEGDPTSEAVQEILLWQRLTMEMMYRKIAHAIAAKGVDASPRDYLNFYCLGNRETTDNCPMPTADPPAGIPATLCATRRMMVYVHSKMMIVDDDYILVGSANINMRSLAGNRDSEIAAGMWQPARLASEDVHHPARGQVYGFRRGLFAEHLGCNDDIFANPSSLECVRRVNEVAAAHWDLYKGEAVVEMEGHLMTYPLEVESDGFVHALPPPYDTFLDLGGSIEGVKTKLPDSLTT
eukprot:jgi/Mesvir1/23853/Mv10655-RA.3